jgi:hypothetical protein
MACYPENKNDWAKLLAGQGVKTFVENNNINNSDELDEWLYENQDEAYDIFRDICYYYLSEINSNEEKE